MEIFAGVDGGGTHTRAVLYALDSNRAVMLDDGPSRLTLLGPDACTDLLVGLLDRGAQQLGGSSKDLMSISICLSGIDSSAQSKLMHGRLLLPFKNAVIEVANDAFAVLSAGTMGKTGLAVIGGTGSIAIGERYDGAIARAGGYGSILGDEGSGFDIGRQGLASAVRSFEGRGPSTVLWDKVAERFGISQALDLVDHIYEGENQVTKVAGFASVVLDAAQKDAVARGIVASAAASYVELVHAVRRQLKDDLGRQVVLAGGLFQNYDVIQAQMQTLLPQDRLLTLRRPQVLGALMRATEQYKQARPGYLSRMESLTSDWIDRLVIRTA